MPAIKGDELKELVLKMGEALDLTPEESERAFNSATERRGGETVLVQGANLLSVVRILERQFNNGEQKMRVNASVSTTPWDGALALVKAIEQEFGVVVQVEGEMGAQMIDVEVDMGETVSVPWGQFEIPGLEEAEVETRVSFDNGRMVFSCMAVCKRKHEKRMRKLLDAMREFAKRESLHRGKAFSISFRDEDGDRSSLPMPKFFPIGGEEPMFRPELARAIERNIMVPLVHAEKLEKEGVSLKRGVLFAGNYGVGKTLLASHIARMAISAGWTFVYVKNSDELPDALKFAQQFQPVVVFAEDVDRVAGQHRTNDVNEILNQLDGIDSKAARIMTILTTNHPEAINQGMMRPGRIDLVLEVKPPDAETVIRMVERFGGSSLKRGEDLSEVGKILAEESPSRVRETINRARLEAVRRTGKTGTKVTAEDLVATAKEVKEESDLFKGRMLVPEPHPLVQLFAGGRPG